MAEDSESGADSPGPVLQKLMPQGVAALATGHLVRHSGAALLRLRLQLLGQTVRVNWVLKRWPGCVMFILLGAKYCSIQQSLKRKVFSIYLP